MDRRRRPSEKSRPRSDTAKGMGSSSFTSLSSFLTSLFRLNPSAGSSPSHDDHEMNDMHQASRGDSESAASLLDRDGPDLSLHFPSDADTQNTQTPKGTRRMPRSKARSTFVKLSSWWWLQPNTVISIITTVGKAAMMVPIAACISQLKWTEFRRPARLSLLQNMDDASRGPWGSLVLLTRARRNRVVLVPVLAFLAVAAVGFEPSAQQILDFPSRTAPVRNASAEIGMATTYTSAQHTASEERFNVPTGYDMSASFATYYRLQSTITLSFIQDPPKPVFSCPGSSCSWKPFSTLAVCGSYQDVTDQGELNIGKTTSEPLLFHSQDNIDDPMSDYTYMYPYITTWNTSSSSTLYKTRPTPFWDHVKFWLDDAPIAWGGSTACGGRYYEKDTGHVTMRRTSRSPSPLGHSRTFSVGTPAAAAAAAAAAGQASTTSAPNETDNLSAEKFLGDAFITESYIHVRWQWITVVLVEVLLTAALLVASIMAVRGDPLLKTSVIALLVHGLEDWRDVEVLQPETSATLEESSEEVIVRLMDNGAGRRLFVKQTT
ncbi:hypothetical protein CSOJ01_00380 [Colletotrichum sojae]|uniref:Uncharacterized protein n=1 Tax=Colletotrichum sojae TaxID=2175907 RepID=A0A8H6JXH5_9PEZI|nr:hypothetical protein CSOJ01_00380 [Colletotrichum sojae]